MSTQFNIHRPFSRSVGETDSQTHNFLLCNSAMQIRALQTRNMQTHLGIEVTVCRVAALCYHSMYWLATWKSWITLMKGPMYFPSHNPCSPALPFLVHCGALADAVLLSRRLYQECYCSSSQDLCKIHDFSYSLFS